MKLTNLTPASTYEVEKWLSEAIWRLTLLLLPIYFILLIIGLPFKMIVTGKWGYGQKFYDNFHAVWMNKLNL